MIDKHYPHIERLVYGQPWAVEPAYLDVIVDTLSRFSTQNNWVEKLLAADSDREQVPDSDVEIVRGIAVVPIQGVLMKRAGLFSRISGATSIEAVRHNLRAAGESDARIVCLKIDSPGGQVTGIAETADMIYAMRQHKLVMTFTDHQMCSAAYWLGSQADVVISTSDAVVGSIGAIAKITDTSRYERNEGKDATVIRTGPNKAAGEGPVTDAQLQIIRGMVEKAFENFIAAVERGRAKPFPEEARDGRIYWGADAQRIGLVDDVMTFEQVIAKYGVETV